MKMNSYIRLSAIFTLGFVFLLGSAGDLFAQKGKDKGNGGGGKHGGGAPEGNPGDGKGGKHGGGNDGWKQQQMGGWEPQARPQPQQQMPQIWNRQARPDYNAADLGGGGKGKDKGKWKDKGSDRRVYNEPLRQQTPWGGGFIPPGQNRKQEVHARNAERKALKNEEKAYRREERERRYDYQRAEPQRRIDTGRQVYRNADPARPVYRNTYPARESVQPQYGYDRYNSNRSRQVTPQYYGQNTFGFEPDYNSYEYNAYDQNGNGYQENGGWKQTLIRTLISSVLGSLEGGENYGYEQDNANYGGPVNYAYNQPNYYNAGYAPREIGYNQGYSSYSNDGGSTGGYDQYSGSLLNNIPISELLGQRGGSGRYVTEMLSQVLAQGYLQGLLAGETARDNGNDGDEYHDPFISEEGGYDPYSSSIGENRRLMSEGYGLGYRDAVSGREQFDSEDLGNVDLVSLVMTNVFRFI